jgi:hypothetical protein
MNPRSGSFIDKRIQADHSTPKDYNYQDNTIKYLVIPTTYPKGSLS